MWLSRIRNMHSESGGQALIFVTLILFTMIALLALTINVGHRVASKIEMQNAADAAAMSGGIWIARGLNLTSILNVSMTEALAFIIFFEAVKKGNDILPVAYGAAYGVASACSAIPFIGAACAVWLANLNRISPGGIQTFRDQTNRIADKAIDLLWKTMDFIRSAEDAVKVTGAIAPAEALRIGELNGAAQFPLFLPLKAELPVKEGTFKDLCEPTREDGGGAGYKNFLCFEGGALAMPITRSPYIKVKEAFRLMWLLIPPFPDTGPLLPPIASIYGFLVDAAFDSVCGSGKGTVEIERDTSSCSECQQKGGSDVQWAGQRIRVENGSTNPNDPPKAGFEDDEKKENLGRVPGNADRPEPFFVPDRLIGYQKVQTAPDLTDPSKPSGCKWFRIDTQSVPKTDANGNIVRDNKGRTVFETATFRTEWVLFSCKFKQTEKVSVTRPDGRPKPKPLVIDPDWVKQSEYLALTRKKVTDKVAYTGLVRAGTREKIAIGPVTTTEAPGAPSLPDFKRGETVKFGKQGQESEKETLSLAQVKVYNSTGADLFNQDWRVRLVPFDPNGLKSDVSQLLTQIPLIKDAAGALIVH